MKRAGEQRWVVVGVMAMACAGVSGGCLGEGGGVDMTTDVGDVTDPDRVDATCEGGPRVPGTCAAGATERIASKGARHINVPDVLSYEDNPPSSGDHRPYWAKWGEYSYLGPQVWLHNLEHGGIAFLYDPCAPTALVDALRVFAQSQPADDGGPFRWVLTPSPGLPTPVAAVAWEWTWQAECVHEESLGDFVVERYRQAPEDLDWDGSYETGWIGR